MNSDENERSDDDIQHVHAVQIITELKVLEQNAV